MRRGTHYCFSGRSTHTRQFGSSRAPSRTHITRTRRPTPSSYTFSGLPKLLETIVTCGPPDL